MKKMVIAIDGPCASGKGTIAEKVAKELGFAYLDSGSLYRIAALHVKNVGVDPEDPKAVAKAIGGLKIGFEEGRAYLDGKDVNDAIRAEDVGLLASKISQYQEVRDELLSFQREYGGGKSLVCDGRDMTSIVFPEADVKVYMTALPEVRAKRRALQLGLQADGADYRKILDDILRRDRRDMTREVAPLVKTDDAFQLDNTYITIDEAVESILDHFYATQAPSQKG